MAVDSTSDEGLAIRKLIPLKTLPGPQFQLLCKNLTVEELQKGHTLFKRGDDTQDLFYLLKGEVSLEAEDLKVETVSSESDLAQFALAHQIPRKIDAVAKKRVRFLRIPPETLKELQQASNHTDPTTVVTEEPVETSTDWMTRLLKSPLFQLIPAADLQKILISLNEIEVPAGETIIKQDEYPGETYFIIKKGQCSLTRKPTANAKEIVLGKLTIGDSFGEAAILADKPRDLTVRALTDMIVLALNKENFLTLIRDSALSFISPKSLAEEMNNGAIIMDIRSPDEYKQGHLEGSINVPFFTLRMTIKTMDRSRKILIICEDSKQSEAAAFILIRNKFDTTIIEGGMKNAQPQASENPATFPINGPLTASQNTDTRPDDASESADEYAESITDQEPELTAEQKIIALLEEQNQELSRRYTNLEKQHTELTAEQKITLLEEQNQKLSRRNANLERKYAELLVAKKKLERNLLVIAGKG